MLINNEWFEAIKYEKSYKKLTAFHMQILVSTVLLLFALTAYADKDELFCKKNKSFWQPSSRITKIFIGKRDSGFEDKQACMEAIHQNLVCNREGNVYRSYSSAEPFSLITSLEFKSLKECMAFAEIGPMAFQSSFTQSSEVPSLFKSTPSSVGYTRKHCEDSRNENHHVRTEYGLLVEGCLPDTLYSWGNFQKLDFYRKNFTSNTDWLKPLARDLYLSSSSISTFGYGPIPIRLKLKEGIKYKLQKGSSNALHCKDLSDLEKLDTLIINQWSGIRRTGLDYIICSMNLVSSWSFAMAEHYDEMVRELQWIETHDDTAYEVYTKSLGKKELWGVDLDGFDFKKQTFLNYLGTIRRLAELGAGEVYSNENSSLDDHFKTNNPIYFNPN